MIIIIIFFQWNVSVFVAVCIVVEQYQRIDLLFNICDVIRLSSHLNMKIKLSPNRFHQVHQTDRIRYIIYVVDWMDQLAIILLRKVWKTGKTIIYMCA